jgi:vacuolar-type H+-ATPase subunit E/Vma4
MGIEAIISRIEADATVAADQNLARARVKVDEILKEGEKKALNEYQTILIAGKKDISQKHAEELSRTMIEARNRVRKQKESLVSQCFEQAAQDLKSVRKSPAYLQILRHLIEEGLRSIGSDTCILSVCGEDYGFAKEIASEISMGDIQISVSPDPVSTSGGVIIKSPGGIMVNNTVEARLARYHKDLLVEIAAILFDQEH